MTAPRLKISALKLNLYLTLFSTSGGKSIVIEGGSQLVYLLSNGHWHTSHVGHTAL